MLFTFNEIIPNDYSVSVHYNVALRPGTYFIECWGAQGGTGSSDLEVKSIGGKGAYASGILKLNVPTTFYLFVGGKGGDGSSTKLSRAVSGWNGGGDGGVDTNDDDGTGAGGGSTDIRYNEDDLEARIIVAAGGSGSAKRTYGAPGGAITGLVPIEDKTYSFKESDTNQENGNSPITGSSGTSIEYIPTSGGGGGYRGGNAPNVEYCTGKDYYKCIASSGSSYVSGHEKCKKNSRYSFILPRLISGKDLMPHYSGDDVYGNEGNGAIKITTLSFCYLTNSNNIFDLNLLNMIIISLFVTK